MLMSESGDQKSLLNFWTALLGILAAIIVLISAIIGLIEGFIAPGLIGGSQPDTPNSTLASEAFDLHERGNTSYRQGQYQEALNYYQQALTIQREVGDRAGEGTTLNDIGSVYYARGEYDQALHNYQQALVIYREVGDKAGEDTVLADIKSLSHN
jgi:tetratricopeptide (TPR) repeat protein